VHHIIQRSVGGSDSPDNLITLCRSCHDSKHPGARQYYIERSKRTRRWR
jgi:5-methylcytosine-specific restriction endonuclease McrA